jgi:hypothetical protein
LLTTLVTIMSLFHILLFNPKMKKSEQDGGYDG